MVMRKALPIINARLMQLLNDVCDFNVRININNSNEVEFLMEQDGIISTLYSHGSGFERTAQLQLGYITAEDDGTCNTFTAIAYYTINPNDGWAERTNYLFNVPATAHRLAFKVEMGLNVFIDDVKKRVLIKKADKEFANTIHVVCHSSGHNMNMCCRSLADRISGLHGRSKRVFGRVVGEGMMIFDRSDK